MVIVVGICNRDEFTCRNIGACIPASYECDGENDCGDWEDEGVGCRGRKSK